MFSSQHSAWLLAAWVVVLFPFSSRSDPPSGGEPDFVGVKALIVTGTNAFRKEKGQRQLKENAELGQAAQYFADFMARSDKYSHTADGQEPWERAAKYKYDYCIVAENIAYQFNSAGFSTRELADGFVQGWIKSPPHRKNMLDADIYDIGVGVTHSAKSDKYYSVQLFGRPKSKEIAFRITNQADAALDYTLDGKTYTVKPRYTITHQACRPPELGFPGTREKGETFHPGKDSAYVIRKTRKGEYTVEEK
jgi:uncharacterized protein YkwD